MHNFQTYRDLLNYLETINSKKYTATRNYLSGNVTKLSPYITHGVISLPQIRKIILKNNDKQDSTKLLQELAWREYFRCVWEKLGDSIFKSIRNEQANVINFEQIPKTFLTPSTDIKSIDTAINNLYEIGYIHNHARMWIAMLGTNIYKYYWYPMSRWMYYHLLDGDLASNMLSWQWVAGTFSSKRYIANQENINTYDRESAQENTFLNLSYEDLEKLTVAVEHVDLILKPNFPDIKYDNFDIEKIKANNFKNIYIYHIFALDPDWHNDDTKSFRIVCVDTDMLEKYPMSQKRIDFIMSLINWLPTNTQIFIGKVGDLFKNLENINNKNTENIIIKNHPLVKYWKDLNKDVLLEDIEYLFPQRQWKSGGFMSWYNN